MLRKGTRERQYLSTHLDLETRFRLITAKSQAGTANEQIEEVECEYQQYLDTYSLARAATLAQSRP